MSGIWYSSLSVSGNQFFFQCFYLGFLKLSKWSWSVKSICICSYPIFSCIILKKLFSCYKYDSSIRPEFDKGTEPCSFWHWYDKYEPTALMRSYPKGVKYQEYWIRIWSRIDMGLTYWTIITWNRQLLRITFINLKHENNIYIEMHI